MAIKALLQHRSRTGKENQSDSVREEDIKNEIQSLAYKLWLERGAPVGSPDADWYEAEARVSDKGRARQPLPKTT